MFVSWSWFKTVKIDTVFALMYYIKLVAELPINELSFVQIHIQTSGQLM